MCLLFKQAQGELNNFIASIVRGLPAVVMLKFTTHASVNVLHIMWYFGSIFAKQGLEYEQFQAA